MKSVNPRIYTRKFYLHKCLGSVEYITSGGKKLHPRVLKLLSHITINSNMRILDVGCGRGDISLYLAKKAREVVGIDYSKAAIQIGNETKKKFSQDIQNKTSFLLMNAKAITFPNDYFDVVICIDVFEHLYHDELVIMLKEIKRVLKKEGILFIDTGTNKILIDFTYKYYILPMNRFLTWIDKKMKGISYDSLPKDPRTPEEKKQHVNEPTYFYLKKLFKNYDFTGSISMEVGCMKQGNSMRTYIYNALVTLYPLSRFFPLNILFAWAFICKMRNRK